LTKLRFLLDSNVLSEPLRPHPNSSIIQKLTEHSEAVATTTIVLHELWYGCYRLPPSSNKRQIIEAYLIEEVEAKIPILSYTSDAAKWFAQERSRLVSIGRTPSYPDGQIAAISHVNNLILVTNNVSDYADFQGLQIENWLL
jgi:tRNA(fMet)-specific endonuclease VapC